jgi:hypothetical protein
VEAFDVRRKENVDRRGSRHGGGRRHGRWLLHHRRRRHLLLQEDDQRRYYKILKKKKKKSDTKPYSRCRGPFRRVLLWMRGLLLRLGLRTGTSEQKNM